jgi:hypothetical protein
MKMEQIECSETSAYKIQTQEELPREKKERKNINMCILTGSAGISRKVKIRNAVLKRKMNVERSLLDDIKTKQLQWYGHVQRVEEGRLPKEVMKWRPTGRRKQGRPKLIWAEGIRGLMGEKALLEEDWNVRNSWRKKII